MEICIITTSFPRTSDDEAGIFIARLSDSLSEEGVRGHVIAPAYPGVSSSDTRGSFTIRRVSYGIFTPGALAYGKGIFPNIRSRPLLLLQAPLLLLSLARGAIRTTSPGSILHGQWLFSGLAAWLASLWTKLPFLITIRGEDAKLLDSPLFRPFFIPALTQAAAVITVSETFLAQLTRRFPRLAPKCHFIPNGVSLEQKKISRRELMESLRLDEETRYLLYAGRVIPLKRIEVLIKILSHPRLSSFHLLAIGKADDHAYLAELHALAESLGCRERVHICGSKAPHLIASFLEHAACYISASSYEGRSNSLLEALAAGKVSIVSDIPGHREVISDKVSGMLFHPEKDPQEIAEEIAEVLSHPEKSAHLSRHAKETVAHLTWEASASVHKKLYEEILASSHRKMRF